MLSFNKSIMVKPDQIEKQKRILKFMFTFLTIFIALLTLRDQIKIDLSEIQLNHFYATTFYQQLLIS